MPEEKTREIPAKAEADAPVRLVLPAEAAGLRLDAALAPVFPHLGLRGRRRLWLHRRVLLNGRECGPAHRVVGGERLEVLPPDERTDGRTDGDTAGHTDEHAARHPTASGAPDERRGIRLAAFSAQYAVFEKPAGLHTAALAGGSGPSLEGLLPPLWEGFRREHPDLPAPLPLLLTRLDAPTSGLVAAAFGPEAAKAFRCLESRGLVDKYYLALVLGRLAAPLACAGRADTAERKKTRIRADKDPDPARHTLAEPLGARETLDGLPATLVRVRIKRGLRHQIRAHLAAAGFPLVGDALYGGRGRPEEFLLRHYRLELPGFTAAIAPLPPEGAAF